MWKKDIISQEGEMNKQSDKDFYSVRQMPPGRRTHENIYGQLIQNKTNIKHWDVPLCMPTSHLNPFSLTENLMGCRFIFFLFFDLKSHSKHASTILISLGNKQLLFKIKFSKFEFPACPKVFFFLLMHRHLIPNINKLYTYMTSSKPKNPKPDYKHLHLISSVIGEVHLCVPGPLYSH